MIGVAFQNAGLQRSLFELQSTNARLTHRSEHKDTETLVQRVTY